MIVLSQWMNASYQRYEGERPNEEGRRTTNGKNEVVTTFTQILRVKEYEKEEKKRHTKEAARKIVPAQIEHKPR